MVKQVAVFIKKRRRSKPAKPQRLFYRSVTNDELVRLITEVGREEVAGVLRAMDLPALTPAE